MNTIYLIPMLLADDTHQNVLPIRIQEVIKDTKVFFVENLKTTRRYISSLKLGIVIDDLTFLEVDKDTKYEEVFMMMHELKTNAGIISEAGCPGVADPGALIVEIAHDLNFKVEPLVGPSSILLALMASGMSGQSFVFHGYLPIKEDERLKKLKSLEREAITKKQTQIFMETPFRNNQILNTILGNLQNTTKLCLACDITASTEYIKTKSILKWKQGNNLPDLHKRPCIFLIY
jgi:16S rRNA (cytidine1402-2'-O)-methyltransferase